MLPLVTRGGTVHLSEILVSAISQKQMVHGQELKINFPFKSSVEPTDELIWKLIKNGQGHSKVECLKSPSVASFLFELYFKGCSGKQISNKKV